MKDKICLFAGTTEGRQLADILKDAADLTVCVATDYGEVLLDGMEGICIHTGRMEKAEMEQFFLQEGFALVIDATHPYASAVTQNIAAAAKSAGTPLLRILRDADRSIPDAVYVDTVAAARDHLAEREGNILLTTGVKELSDYSGLDMERVWARVLPLTSSLEACAAAGIPASHIFAAQGPFSFEMNLAQMKAIGAKYLVTKASGKNGGFDEKIKAAASVGAVPVIIGLPPQTEGLLLDEAVAQLEKNYPIRKRKISVIGVGPGAQTLLTAQAKHALAICDCVLGAKPVLDVLSLSKSSYPEYVPEKVCSFLQSHPSVRHAAIVLRGDVGFFSGAKKLLQALKAEDVTLIPGVSSAALFAAKLGVSWDDGALISLHGRTANLIRTVARNKKTFVLAGGGHTPQRMMQFLCDFGFGKLSCAVGERLSYPEETISRDTAESLKNRQFDSLSVVYIENDSPEPGIRFGIPDEAFIRGNVPMTKAEVRAVSLAKLSPDKDSVIWDVGAGTGSVSVECALAAFDGSVYAVEKNAEAAALVRQNRIAFKTDNLQVIEGCAPQALHDLPIPTHVFIGGSGKLREILTVILKKNASAVIVINAVTLETQAEVLSLAQQFSFREFDAVSLSVSRAMPMGRFHLTAAQNPVWVFTLRGGIADG